MLLEIAQLPRSTFYYHNKRQDKQDKYACFKAEIAAIYHENKGRYGYRRITDELHNRKIYLNHKTVQRLMKELGLVCRVRMKKYRSYKGEKGTTADNELNREFRAEMPNQKWVTDVTEFRLFGQKLYLSPILDLCSGDIVTYTMSDTISLRSTNYRIDFTKMTLIMTADFALNAYIEDTEEYKILTRLKKDFPDLKIERKTHRTPSKYTTKSGEEYTHNQYKDLTYKRMEKFLSRIPNGATYRRSTSA